MSAQHLNWFCWRMVRGLLAQTSHLQDLNKRRGCTRGGRLAIESRSNDLNNASGKVGIVCVALGRLHSTQQLHSTVGDWVVWVACIRCIRSVDNIHV